MTNDSFMSNFVHLVDFVSSNYLQQQIIFNCVSQFISGWFVTGTVDSFTVDWFSFSATIFKNSHDKLRLPYVNYGGGFCPFNWSPSDLSFTTDGRRQASNVFDLFAPCTSAKFITLRFALFLSPHLGFHDFALFIYYANTSHLAHLRISPVLSSRFLSQLSATKFLNFHSSPVGSWRTDASVWNRLSSLQERFRLALIFVFFHSAKWYFQGIGRIWSEL